MIRVVRAFCVALVLCVGCTKGGSGERSSAKASGKGEDGDAATQPFDRDDDEAVREAFEKATGRALDEHDCVVWPRSFERVVLVGSFANDRGCMHEGMFIDRTWHEKGGAQAALATAGWDDADIEKRQELARAWVEQASQAFGGRFVDKSQTAFEFEDTPDFEPVRVRATQELGVVVSGWVEEPAGMVWESAYRFVEYRFGRDGSVERTLGKQFSVEGQRIKDARDAANADGPGE